MFKVVTKKQDILATQQLDLIYSQLGMLYEVIPNAPRPFIDLPKHTVGPHFDCVIGSVFDSMSQLVAQVK